MSVKKTKVHWFRANQIKPGVYNQMRDTLGDSANLYHYRFAHDQNGRFLGVFREVRA